MKDRPIGGNKTRSLSHTVTRSVGFEIERERNPLYCYTDLNILFVIRTLILTISPLFARLHSYLLCRSEQPPSNASVKPRCGQCTRLKKSPCEYDHSCDDNTNTHNGPRRSQSQSQSNAQGNRTGIGRQGSGSSGSSQSQSRARAAGKTETRGPGPNSNSNSQGTNGTGPVVGMDLDRDLGTGMDLDMGLEMDMGGQRNVNDNINNQNILDYGFISATSTTTSMSAGAGAHALEAGGAIGPSANGNSDNAENGNGSENRNILPDLALSPNSYEALTSLLQSMNEVDQNNNLDAGLGLSSSSSQSQMQMQMQLQAQMGIGPGMQMSTGLTPMPNLSTLNSLSFPFDLLTTSTFGGPDLDLSYAALGNQTDFVATNNNNVNANADARPNGMLGETRSNSACDPIVATDPGKPWFFEKQPLRLLNEGSDRFGDYDAETQGGGSFTPSGFELVMDQAQAMVDDFGNDLVRRRRSDTGGNTGGNSSMDAFRLPTSFRPGSDPTSGSASASGSGSGAGSAVPSPGSVINLSSLTPGAGQTTTLTTAPTAEEIPAIFRERLLGSFMKQGRRFGLIYHWPTFWERMRGEEHLRPHPAWVNAMVS